jgi:NADPH-ferrihemoprotein reductase
MGKFVFKHLTTIGGDPIVPLGLGDDDADITDDFEVWCEALFAAIDAKGLLPRTARPSVEVTTKEGYHVKMEAEAHSESASGASGLADGVSDLTLPWVPESEKHEAKVAKVACVRELHSAKSERSCIHVELDLSGELAYLACIPCFSLLLLF